MEKGLHDIISHNYWSQPSIEISTSFPIVTDSAFWRTVRSAKKACSKPVQALLFRGLGHSLVIVIYPASFSVHLLGRVHFFWSTRAVREIYDAPPRIDGKPKVSS
jgi:hypothetical protein